MRTTHRQPDLFGSPQGNLFADDDPAPRAPAQMEATVRPRLAAMLAELRAAQRMPWDAQQERVNRTLFPQMTNWLPEAEREHLRAAFGAELRRLGAA